MELATIRRVTLSVCAVINGVIDDRDDSTSSSSSGISDLESENDDFELDFESLYFAFQYAKTRGALTVREKLSDYVERVIPGYDRHEFHKHFRLFPETVEMILTVIGPRLNRQGKGGGRNPISSMKQLLISLWFTATSDSYRSVCVKFGVARATAFRALQRLTYSLHCAAPQFIRWPKHGDAVRVINEFQTVSGFPSVIGAIDSTHIRIRAPRNDAASYINRKGYHSINLQAVCDAHSSFIHCYAGHVGSVHDARVYKNSPVAQFGNRPEEYFYNDSHLIGDAAYPLNKHLIVPFRDNGHLTQRQQNLNYCLSSSRMAIERAFGLLKIRFRILLDCLPLTDITKIPEFIMACCVLHNICMAGNDVLPGTVIRGHEDEEFMPYVNDRQGSGKRNRIAAVLPMRNRH